MRSIYNFIVKPKGTRYNNIKKVDGKELILNTEIFHHQYVNREAIVLETPIVNKTPIKKGDIIIVHHNIFRRWHNVKGVEKIVKAGLKKINIVFLKIKYLLIKKTTRGTL